MVPDLQEICTLLKSFRDLCRSPAISCDSTAFARALNEMQTTALTLDHPSYACDHGLVGKVDSMAA
jgi:hypothetical protein